MTNYNKIKLIKNCLVSRHDSVGGRGNTHPFILHSSVALTPEKELPYTLNRGLGASKGPSVCFREGTILLRLPENDVGFLGFYPSLLCTN
jgi:hypothetical protein